MAERFHLVFLTVTLLLLCSCGALEPAAVTRPPVLDEGQRYAEQIMQALTSGDYESYTEYLGEDMLKASSRSTFEQLHLQLVETLGSYRSSRFLSITHESDFILLYFECSFELGDITLKLVLEPKEPFLISGIWFTDFSPP